MKSLNDINLSKILLRELKVEDYLDVFKYSNTINGYLGPFLSEDDTLQFLKDYYKTLNPGLPKSYAIVSKKESIVIGEIDFHTYDYIDNSVTIGFILNELYRKKGIMSKALKEVIKELFLNFSFDKINVSVKESNIDSLNVILNCDFKYESKSIIDNEVIFNYKLLRNDFERGMLKWQ